MERKQVISATIMQNCILENLSTVDGCMFISFPYSNSKCAFCTLFNTVPLNGVKTFSSLHNFLTTY